MPRHLLLSGLVLLSPLLQPAAYAQPTNWRVTILQITSEDWQDPDCVNASVTVTIPGPTGVGFADLCGGRASLTVAAQNVTLEFTGEKDITLEGIATCHWTITTPVRGKGFISGGAVPATSMTGTANTDCGAIGNFQNEVDGSFQAQRVAVGGGIAITNFTGDVEITLPGQAPVILTPVNAAGLVLPTGTRIHVRAGSSLKLAASGGSVEMGENTELALFTARFFLLVPSFKPLQNSFLKMVPLRDRCSFGRFPWLISQALSVTYMAGERRLYLERNCRLPESPAHSRRRNREGPASSKGLNSQRGFGPAVEPRRKSRPRSTSLHGSSPCKCQRLSTLRWDRLPPSRPSTKSGARAGGRRLSDRRLHRWLAGTSASAPSSHGAADLLGLNRAHICVRNPQDYLEMHSEPYRERRRANDVS